MRNAQEAEVTTRPLEYVILDLSTVRKMTEHDTARHQRTHRHTMTQNTKRSLLSEVSKHWHQARFIGGNAQKPSANGQSGPWI
jgi:hypothetical protein